jgi:hypothetical protein
MSHALALFCVAVLAGDLEPLAALPPRDPALVYWQAACQFCQGLEARQQAVGGYHADQVGEVLWEARRLRDFWGHVADAGDSSYCLETRVAHARAARELCDFRSGWPPFLPWQRLPYGP